MIVTRFSKTALQLMVTLVPVGQSVKHHLLSSYYHAILAVMLAEFSNKGFADGMAGIVRLAEASPYIQVHHVALKSKHITHAAT